MVKIKVAGFSADSVEPKLIDEMMNFGVSNSSSSNDSLEIGESDIGNMIKFLISRGIKVASFDLENPYNPLFRVPIDTKPPPSPLP